MQGPPHDSSLLLSMLMERADKRDTVVYAHAAAETQNTINEFYTTSKAQSPGHHAAQSGFLEV